MKMKYKFLEHTADVKFQAFGKNLEEVFENSVLAVVETISRKEKIKSKKIKRVKIEGRDNESLLYNLIEEVIYLFDAEEFIVAKAKINFDETTRSIEVEFHGDDSKNYEGLDQIKSVTYNEMFVRKEKGKWAAQVWAAQVVLDI